MVLRYNLSLLGQGTGVNYSAFYKCFFPYIMMIGLISKIRDSQLVPDIHPPYWLALFFVGVFIAVLITISQSTFNRAISGEGKF